MKPRGVLLVLGALVFAAVSFRLGVWQLARLHQKQAMNARLRASLAGAPEEAGPSQVHGAPPARPVRLIGRFEPSEQILLRGRLREGEPGVEVVTPFRLAADSSRVLVMRGWLPAEDAATIPAARIPADTSTHVNGLAEGFERRGPTGALHALEGGPTRVWSAARLDSDTLVARFAGPLGAWWLRALPDPTAPVSPRRDPPEPANESMHLGYAIQWFAIGTLVPGGMLALAFRRPRTGPAPLPASTPGS